MDIGKPVEITEYGTLFLADQTNKADGTGLDTRISYHAQLDANIRIDVRPLVPDVVMELDAAGHGNRDTLVVHMNIAQATTLAMQLNTAILAMAPQGGQDADSD